MRIVKNIFRTIWSIFLFIILFFMIQTPALSRLSTDRISISDNLVGDLERILIFVLTFAISLFLCLRYAKWLGLNVKFGDVTLTKKQWKQVAFWGFSHLLVLIISIIIISIYHQSGTSGEQYSITRALMMALTMTISAPLLEELLFRGILQGICSRFSPTFALILTTFLFAYAHGTTNLIFFGSHFFSGLIFGVLYMKVGKLFPSILVHSCGNAIICLLYFF